MKQSEGGSINSGLHMRGGVNPDRKLPHLFGIWMKFIRKWSRSETLRPETPSRRRRSKEQSRRIFACPHQKKRTKITEIQVGPSSSKTTFDPRSDLQSLQPSPPPHLQKHTSKIQATGTNRMEHHNDNGLRLRRQLNETSGWFS